MSEKFSIEFSSRELNYIEMALISRIRSLDNDKAGNAPEIRRFSIRVFNKVRRGRGLPVFQFRETAAR